MGLSFAVVFNRSAMYDVYVCVLEALKATLPVHQVHCDVLCLPVEYARLTSFHLAAASYLDLAASKWRARGFWLYEWSPLIPLQAEIS